MDERFLFMDFVYLFLITLAISVLPTTLFSGTVYNSNNLQNLQYTYNDTSQNVEGLGEQITFFNKFISFFFKPFTISGIPAIIGLFIFGLNILSIAIPIIWIYDKVRGIG